MASTLPPLTGVPKEKYVNGTPKKMEITIHVCDEAKNVKKDFTCQRELLLEEMKYFQDYLSSDTEKWDDVDISVHCDVKIFDWLIRYVKRDEENAEPSLDINNAVSILISSDFLKMDKLVSRCIDYCYNHLSTILATPCNMNCINDALVNKLASKYNQRDLEKVKDKKDKFKSKLFCKLLQRLFDDTFSDEYSPNNASRLFRCVFCDKLLLPSVQQMVRCTHNRTSVNPTGSISYNHIRDHNWNVTEFIGNLKKNLKTWRAVYWRVWSIINYMECRICKTIFPLCDYKTCLYHPDKPVYMSDESCEQQEVKNYPCCDQKLILFESIQTRSGCAYKDHSVEYTQAAGHAGKDDEKAKKFSFNTPVVYEEMMTVADMIFVTKTPPNVPNQASSFFDIRNMVLVGQNLTNKKERVLSATKESDKGKERRKSPARKPNNASNVTTKKRPTSTTKLNQRNKQQEGGEEDTNSDDEQDIFRVVINHKDTPSLSKNIKKTWNLDLPSRLNQDMQRESDLKRMNDMIKELRQIKPNTSNDLSNASQQDAGLFHRIEGKLRSEILSSQVSKADSVTSTNMTNRRARIGAADR